jgi:phosphoribulokinase
MSAKHPIVAITGSSGAGTTSVMWTFQQIFRREGVKAAVIEGDSFHRYDRTEMRDKMKEEAAKGNEHFSHFGPESNLFEELEATFRAYGATGTGKSRKYLHDDEEAAPYKQKPGTFTPWEDLAGGTDLLFYEGLHGGVKTEKVDIAGQVDLLVGVAPAINLEWIQNLRRIPDYVNYICPQFSHTHVNFQRVPTVDTSNPFIAREIPSPDESMLVIRFRDPKGIDFPYLLSMLKDGFMSRANTIVCPGGKMALAMQLIFTPMIWQLMDRKKRAF